MKELQPRLLRTGTWLIMLLLVFSLAFASGAPLGAAQPRQSRLPVSSAAGPASPSGAAVSLYLPAVLGGATPPNVFGMTMSNVTPGGGLGLVTATASKWMRGPYIHWASVEPTVGARNWAAGVPEAQLLNAAQNGLEMIFAVSQAPAWAQQIAGKPCGPILQSRFDEFAAFMRDAVARYSAPPYNITYWEMWNEPDIDFALVAADSPYGCWGNSADPYYGGGYYGDMLEAVVPAMRQANPNIKVLVGGLLLDCDPDNPPAGKNCRPSRFMEGILRSGSAPFFDGISFHAYDYYAYSQGPYNNPNWHAAWNTTGPVGRVKTNFLKQLLSSYNVTGKLLLNTEVALLCYSACSGAFEAAKSAYVAQAYAVAIADGLVANVWYSLDGWENSQLMDSSQNPLPAYEVYQFAAEKLSAAQYQGALTGYPNLTGYAFGVPGKRWWVLWAPNGGTHVANLPGTPAALYQADGTPLSLTSTPSVGVEPIYVEWIP
jgi:hypothetical protein